MAESTNQPGAQSVPAATDQTPVKGAGIGVGDAIALKPGNWAELWNFASLIAKTDFVPQSLRGNAGAVLAAVQMGHEVGLPPMSSLRWIAVIRGVPAIWGDGFWSLVKSSSLCEWTKELAPHEALAAGYGECTVKRRGDPEAVTRRYTKEMAEQAGLWGGKGATQDKREMSVWFTNPGRMLQMRARMLAGRDAIPEVLGGLSVREEVLDDYPETLPADSTRPFASPKAISESADVAFNPEEKQANPESETKPAEEKKETQAAEQKKDPHAKQMKPAQTSASSAPVDQAQEEKILELIEWVSNCSDEDLFAEPNHLLTELKAVKGTAAQLRVLKPFNDRRQQIQNAPGFGE